MSTNTETYSQEQIVTDHISLRLPVKSLLRFKCVCKNWRELFQSATFIRKHFDQDSIRPRLQIGKFGVDYKHEDPIRSFNFFILPEKIYSGCVPTHQRYFRIEGVTDYRDIYGPIDGLFLLEKGHFMDNPRFGWWNPATKKLRLVPKVTFDDLLENFDDYCRMLGIGRDIVNEDYKIIWFRTFWDETTSDLFPKIFAAVYSSKNDSWKYLENPNFSYECQVSVPISCTYLKGKYHWLTSSQVICDKDNVFYILTFDFTSDLFGKLEGPPIPGNHWATMMLRGGHIATMSSENSAQPTAVYDIWVMIREKNWIKIYVMTPNIPWHWPVGIHEYDKFIFELTETMRMFMYDQSAKEATNLGFDFFGQLQTGFNWSTHYKESLFPMPIRTENPTDQDTVEYFFTKF